MKRFQFQRIVPSRVRGVGRRIHPKNPARNDDRSLQVFRDFVPLVRADGKRGSPKFRRKPGHGLLDQIVASQGVTFGSLDVSKQNRVDVLLNRGALGVGQRFGRRHKGDGGAGRVGLLSLEKELLDFFS